MDQSWKSLKQAYQTLSPARRRIIVCALGVAFLLLVFVHSHKDTKFVPNLPPRASLGETSAVAGGAFSPAEIDSLIHRDKARVGPRNAYEVRPGFADGDNQPQISYSAELAVATKEFGRARSSMEEILDRHRGYTAKLRMVGQPAGSTLSATLRVPSSEYSSAVIELKGIGNLERDEEAADEVVQQRGDLEARPPAQRTKCRTPPSEIDQRG